MYAYCQNDPVMNIDPTGYLSFGKHYWNSIQAIGLLIEILIIAIPVISGFFKAARLYYFVGKLGQKALRHIAATALKLLIKTIFKAATRRIVQTLVVGLTMIIFDAIGDGIGLTIAKWLDKLDGNKDGYVFG